jgi:hypothetical protein
MKKSTYVFIANLLVLALVSLVWFIGSDYFPNSPFSLALSGSFGFEYLVLLFLVAVLGLFIFLKNTLWSIIFMILVLIGEIYFISIAKNVFYDIFLLTPLIIAILTIITLWLMHYEPE